MNIIRSWEYFVSYHSMACATVGCHMPPPLLGHSVWLAPDVSPLFVAVVLCYTIYITRLGFNEPSSDSDIYDSSS